MSLLKLERGICVRDSQEDWFHCVRASNRCLGNTFENEDPAANSRVSRLEVSHGDVWTSDVLESRQNQHGLVMSKFKYNVQSLGNNKRSRVRILS